ncbi:MAG: hypothetical protein ACFNZW_09040 [Coriobacteriaceae bacterium]
MKIIVLDRIEERHPNISKADAAAVWASAVASMPGLDKGDSRCYVGIGFDRKGREIEIVAVRKDIDTWVIIHSQTPAQTDIKRKLGFIGGRR